MRDWLRALRKEKGLTMKELGGKLGISESYYCAIESGDRQKRLDLVTAQGLAKHLGISVSRIVKLEDERQED